MRVPSSVEPLLVVILGPTASGKSELAIKLAQDFSGEIVSCDSVAVYRHFEIGTAKPSAEQRAAIPHHLLDVVEPGETFTAGDYARQARADLQGIGRRGKLPIVVGGSGLYLRALLEGLFPGPQRSEELRQRLRARGAQHGSAYLHKLLRRIDPASAVKIHRNDGPKLIRAIEVCLETRSPMSALLQEGGRDALQGFRVVRIGLDPPREALYQRINQRAERMFADGLVEETKSLLESYATRMDMMPLQSLGYRQAAKLLQGELTREQALALTQQGHRNYAKRQMTWFRREPGVTWLRGFGDEAEIARQAAELISAAACSETDGC